MAEMELIKKFIINELLHEKDESKLKADDPLLEEGIIDSMGIQQLVAFLEKKFSISIPDDEIIPDNFQSIENISNFVKKNIAANYP